MYCKYLITCISIFIVLSANAQVVINEVVSSNTSGIVDEDGEYPDWVELYNTSDKEVNLEGYVLNDDPDVTTGWSLPDIVIKPESYLLVFASDKNRSSGPFHLKTIISEGDSWQYYVPSGGAPDEGWREPGFDAIGWQDGVSGFGYADGDDNTVINPLQLIYIRKAFEVEKPDLIQKMILHVDYDDAFAAFINGKLVAQANLSFTNPDNYYNVFVPTDHEAAMYYGSDPDVFDIDLSGVELSKGENILSIQGYNVSTTSSDFSLIPFLTIGSSGFRNDSVESFMDVKGQPQSFHTNFKITSDGESVYLFTPESEVADSVFVEPLNPDISYGRYPDGQNSWAYFNMPTPREANTNPENSLPNDSVYYSIPAGFYESSLQVEIYSANEDDTIRYTTDGAKPDNGSPIYSEAISINKTTVLKAAKFINGERRGQPAANTYFINDKHTTPVVSLSTAPKNFFDYHEGILVEGPNAEPEDPRYGANYWMDWEKEVHFELFDKNEINQIDQGAGVKVAGGYSRVTPQKSMALFARSKYGKGSFEYPFFNDRDYNSFEAILLRNSGNDFWYTMFRDGYVSEIVKHLDVERLAYQPSSVYLNGEYWGVMNIREKPNEHYFESTQNVDPDDLVLLEGNASVIHGSSQGYNSLMSFVDENDLSDEEKYKHVAGEIDVSCFIDYQLTQIYINNRDWPGNNIKYWRSKTPNGKWRWLLYDTDFGFGLYNDVDYIQNGIRFASEQYGPDWPNPPWSTLLLRRLLDNISFKNQFINRMADLLNTTFLPDEMNAKLDSVKALFEPEIETHFSKWCGDINTWNTRVEAIQNFNMKRPGYVRNHFRNYFGLPGISDLTLSLSDAEAGKVKVNTIIPDTYPFKGTYFEGVPVTFTVMPTPGYRFVRWEGDFESTNENVEVFFTRNSSIKAVFEYTGEQETDIVFNEINYLSGEGYESGDWVELYNNGGQTVDLFGWRLEDSNPENAFVFPEGTVLYPGQYLVICENAEDFSVVYPQVDNYTGEMQFGLSGEGETIILYDMESNLIDRVSYLPSAPWPSSPYNTAATIELSGPAADNSEAASWMAGYEGGTPGEKNSVYTSTENYAGNMQSVSCVPSPFSTKATLIFYAEAHKQYNVVVTDLKGRIVKKLQGHTSFAGNNYVDLFVSSDNIASGMYIVSVKVGNNRQVTKIIKK
ncbi:MAG: CotH kinase family protein [Prolixibacteraceae bacterium]|nr:CotH kinase family protein [Prolixibacteraceae bacterium]